MASLKFFRDPIHGQLAWPRNGVVHRLIDCAAFQRLRHIRQNGLTSLLFHGMEHSRFAHSLGVAHLAGEMFDRIVRNMELSWNDDLKRKRQATVVAALLHDIGHGPFSHTLEEVLEKTYDGPQKW